jgi:hypothetical protein
MLKRIGAEEDGEFKAVASGTLPSGRPVVVNADGTVSVAATITEAVGTATVFESAETNRIESTYDSSNNKVVIVYRDVGNNYKGTAIVGTVSGTSISFGSPALFYDAGSDKIKVTFDSSNNKVVVVFCDTNNGQARAAVGTVSGTSISFGSDVTFDSGVSNSETTVTFDSTNNKVVIAWRDAANSGYGTAIVGTVSGTSISFGSATVFNSASTNYTAITFDANAGKVVVAYQDTGDSAKGNAIVGTVSGTGISFGSEATYTTNVVGHVAITYDSSAQKTVVVYQDASDGDDGKAQVGTISGTSISFGSAVTYESGSALNNEITYYSSAGKVVVVYRDGGNSNYGTYAVGTVSGTAITFETPVVFEEAYSHEFGIAYDSNAERVVFSYQDVGNSQYGTAIVLRLSSTNLTSENYIGMSRGVAVQTGSADSVGSETEFVSNMGNEISAGVYDPDSSKVVLAYADQGNSIRGTAVVGTVSGTSISFGTPANFETVETTHIGITYDTTNDKVVIVYRDGAGNNNYGTAIVGTVSGTSISFGSEAVYNTATSQYNSAAFDSNTGKVVIAYKDADASVQSRVATVSGTSISFGTEVQVTSNGTYVKAVFDSNSNKVVVIYRDGGNSNYGTARVGTVSGTDISFGSAVVFASSSTEDVQATFDSTNNKIVIGYKDGGDSDKGKTVVGTVSGTSISFGSAVTFNTGGSFGMNGVVYNSNQNKVFFFYTSSAVGKVLSGTVSGTAVGSLSSEFTYHNASTGVPFQVYDVASTNIVAAYRDGADSKGKAVVFKPDNIATTRGQVTNGQAASVDVIGSVSTNQIGLTAGQQYFVQNDGTISTTADSPSVLAGTAISATELVVKT